MATGYKRHATQAPSRDKCAAADYLRHPRVCHGWGLMSCGTFRHSVPRLSSISRCLGPTQRRDPVSSSIGGQPPSPRARCRAHYGS